jgi:hypothetical protein
MWNDVEGVAMMKAFITRLKSMLPFATAALCLCGCTAAAPANQGVAKLPVETLWAANQSGYAAAQPQTLYVSDAERLNALARANPNRAATAMLGQRRVDWRREAVVWLYMGHKTSGGYGLRLASPEAIVSHGIAVITVHWREPSPGALVTQQLTSPCLVLKLPKGNYDKIEIKDEISRVRTRLVLSNNN